MKYILLILLFPLCALAQFSDVVVYWDAARTDTQAAIHGTDSLVSQPFYCTPDMTLHTYVQGGDTANASLDSSKVRVYAQYAYENVAAFYSYTWCDDDSFGIDSTFFDKSIASRTFHYGESLSPSCPALWCRLIAKGLGTNCKDTGDSTKWSNHILRYQR